MLLNGNPGKRKTNQREPKPDATAPTCPKWLTPQAKVAWRWLAKELDAMSLLTKADAHAMASYCVTYARWRSAEEFLIKNGDCYPLRDNQGKLRCMQQFPQVSIARNLLQLLKSYQQEFGLTPAARTRIEVPQRGNPSGKKVLDRIGRPI